MASFSSVADTTLYLSAASRCVHRPVSTETHSSYLSLGGNRRRFLPLDTPVSDTCTHLLGCQAHRTFAGFFLGQMSHEIRRIADSAMILAVMTVTEEHLARGLYP